MLFIQFHAARLFADTSGDFDSRHVETSARPFLCDFRVFRFARLGDGASSAEIELALAGDICAVFDAVVSRCERRRRVEMTTT